MPKTEYFLLLVALLLTTWNVQAQLGGEELPPGVTHDDVYRVADQMYCEVCEGIPLSTCTSVTCARWRQEIANLLGQGYTDEEIKEYFAERYGDEVTGVPLKTEDKGIAFGLPFIAILLVGIAILIQGTRMLQKGETRAQQAARTAGLRAGYDRPVPDNVDPDALETFLKMVENTR